MASQSTPTKEPTETPAQQDRRGIGTASPRALDAQRPPDARRSAIWLVWVGIAAALAAAIWLVIAGVTVDYEVEHNDRANQAATARLQGLADQYETARSDRASQAATARLQGLADQYHSTP